VLHSKGNNQQVKRQGTECDKVFAHDIWQGIDIQNIAELQKYEKVTQLKMDKT
jgi:hypothetical protein